MHFLHQTILSPTALVDEFAANAPDDAWAKAPAAPVEGNITWRDITWVQLKRVIDFMAHWMEMKLGLGSGDEPVAYVGINDIRYPVVIMAALKCGYKSFLPSPRNASDTNLALLKATRCTKFIFSPELRGLINELERDGTQVRYVQAPDLQDLLTVPEDVVHESRTSTQMEDHETVLILHSSGTTGVPKPIHLKAGVFRVGAKSTLMPVPEGRQNVHNKLHETNLLLLTTPFFHVYAILMLIRSLYHQGQLMVLPAEKPPTAELVLDAISEAKPTAMACTPSLLEDACNLLHGLEILGKLETVFCGGAPLAKVCGDKVSGVTTLLNTIGTTEIFTLPNLVPSDPADWEYFEWNPNAGIVMEPVPDSKLAELVVRRQPGNDFQTAFFNQPDASTFRTQDIYEQHPTKSGLWKYVGRADDLIVLSNGEKVNPVPLEKVVEGHPWVRGAIVVGTRQFQTGLIIELHAERVVVTFDELMAEVWPCVEQANAQSPSHARIWRSMIRFAVAGKPFVRSPKGSIIRQATCQLYEEDIKLLYANQPATTNGATNGIQETAAHIGNDIQILDLVRQTVRSVLAHRSEHVADDTDIFNLGIDSLQVLQLRQGLLASGIQCTPRMVYENPSIHQLSQLLSKQHSNVHGCMCNSSDGSISREEKMSALIHRYSDFTSSQKLPRSVSSANDPVQRADLPSDHGQTILLIGSTGHLGTYLLQSLLQHNPPLSRIYCLNHDPNAAARQHQTFLDFGLSTTAMTTTTTADDTPTLDPRVHFLTGLSHHPYLGLSESTYTELTQRVDLILFNAWPVHFTAPLERFEDVIAGVKRVAEFAAESVRKPRVVFVSSVASVGTYAAVRKLRQRDDGGDGRVDGVGGDGGGAADENGNGRVMMVPEEFDADNSLPAKQGYGESKHVAGCVLAEAVRQVGIEVTILRVGQLAGALEGKGVWSRHEWMPSLIKTAVSLGKIPHSLGAAQDAVRWVPVDVAARAVLDLAGLCNSALRESNGLQCFNLVNPRSAQWSELAVAIQQHYAEHGRVIKSVALDEWLEELKAAAEKSDADDIRRYPALKLLDFFEDLVKQGKRGAAGVFITARAVILSPSMAGMDAVNGKLMRKWLREWDFGVLDEGQARD